MDTAHAALQLWGQSKGASLTHQYTLAYPDDPLVAKFGVLSLPSGTVVDLATTPDPYEGFDIVAKSLGCNYGNDSAAELECMRQVSWVQISEFINRYNGTPAISFVESIREFEPHVLDRT